MSQHLRQRVAELVTAATDGDVPVAEVLAGNAALSALGLGSLGLLRLVDALELEFGVEIDLCGNGGRLDTLDDIADHLTERGSQPLRGS